MLHPRERNRIHTTEESLVLFLETHIGKPDMELFDLQLSTLG